MDRLSSEMICSRLVQLKQKNELSYQDIADASNVPLSTVKRVFSGKTDTLGFHTLYDLVTAMGGTMEEFLEITPTKNKQAENVAVEIDRPVKQAKALASDEAKVPQAANEKENNEAVQSHAETVRIYQELVLSYKMNLEKNQKWLLRLFVVCLCLVIAIIVILLYDAFTPGIGYIRR